MAGLSPLYQFLRSNVRQLLRADYLRCHPLIVRTAGSNMKTTAAKSDGKWLDRTIEFGGRKTKTLFELQICGTIQQKAFNLKNTSLTPP
jgi:hypothetical protein